MKNTNKGVILALITLLCWGLLPIGLKVALKMVDTFTIVWVRFVMAFAALALWFLITDRKQFKILIKPPWELVVATLALSVNYICFMYGVKLTSPSNAQVIIQVGPVLLAISGIFMFNEKVKKQQILGFVVVVVGFVLFYYEQLKSTFATPSAVNAGMLFTLMAAIAWAVYGIMQKKMVHKYPPQTLNLFLYGIPTLLYLPVAKISTLSTISVDWWAVLVFLGANTLIAYGCMNASLKYLDANKVSAIIVNNPILTFIIMAILTTMEVSWIEPEHFSLLAWAGAFLFIFGSFMVVRSGNKK